VRDEVLRQAGVRCLVHLLDHDSHVEIREGHAQIYGGVEVMVVLVGDHVYQREQWEAVGLLPEE
jgi:hypothetical protein